MEVRRGDVGPGEHEAPQRREREQNAEGGDAAHTGVGLEEVTQVPHLVAACHEPRAFQKSLAREVLSTLQSKTHLESIGTPPSL